MAATESTPLLKEKRSEQRASAWSSLACGGLLLLLVCGPWIAYTQWLAHVAVRPLPTPANASHTSGSRPATPSDAHLRSRPHRQQPVVYEHDWADDKASIPQEPATPSSRELPRHAAVTYPTHDASEDEEAEPAPTFVPASLRAEPHDSTADELSQHYSPLNTVLTERCSLELRISNGFCGGLLATALSVEEARIRQEITNHLPGFVQGVALAYEGDTLMVNPTVKISSKNDQVMFGVNPQQRLRCTFESLMRSSKVAGATRLFGEYSAGWCTAEVGAARCGDWPNTNPPCDPLGDVLISLH